MRHRDCSRAHSLLVANCVTVGWLRRARCCRNGASTHWRTVQVPRRGSSRGGGRSQRARHRRSLRQRRRCRCKCGCERRQRHGSLALKVVQHGIRQRFVRPSPRTRGCQLMALLPGSATRGRDWHTDPPARSHTWPAVHTHTVLSRCRLAPAPWTPRGTVHGSVELLRHDVEKHLSATPVCRQASLVARQEARRRSHDLDW